MEFTKNFPTGNLDSGKMLHVFEGCNGFFNMTYDETTEKQQSTKNKKLKFARHVRCYLQ
jgi:hypothetical protein